MIGRKLITGGSISRGALKATAIWLCLLVFVAPVTAENIGVDPEEWDFGDVLVGDTASTTIQLMSLGPTPLTISMLEIVNDPTGVFSIDNSPSGAMVLLPGEFFDALISFTPDTLGLYTAELNILSDAVPPDNDFDVVLRGVGVTDTSNVPAPAAAWLLGVGLLGWRLQVSRRSSR